MKRSSEHVVSHSMIERPTRYGEHRTPMQRRAVAALADHPYRLELVGGLRALAWPSVCANCGAGTERRIYAMQNQSFAQALADANRDRVWNADDDRRSGRRRLAGLAVAGMIGVAVWIYVMLAM